MKRPSFQFYPGDWSTDLALRRCSPAARGVWMDVLCALHNSDDQYGLVRWPLKEVASTIGASLAHVRELVEKGVLKGSDTEITHPLVYVPRSGRKDGEPVTLIEVQPGPLWYSKRLVKDEYIRTIRGESTRFGVDGGETPKADKKASPKPPFGDGTSSSSSSTTSPSLRSGEGATKRASRQKRAEVPLITYLALCKAEGKKPIPDDHPIRAYCADAGITGEMVQVSWLVFRDKYLTGEHARKGYKDWPGHFANNIKNRWQNLWFVNAEGAAEWTATGLQAKRVIETRSKPKEPVHEPA